MATSRGEQEDEFDKTGGGKCLQSSACGLQTPSPAKRRAVFLDRDGVINEDVNYLRRLEDLRLIPGAVEAIRMINASGYLAIVVTNQSAVARNLCTVAQVEAVNRHLAEMLREGGARLDAVYFCPHHPGPLSSEANPDFVCDCNCRKPKTGMIEQARRDYDIDPSQSFLIGNAATDIQCGRNAGLTAIGVRTGQGYGAGNEPELCFGDLAEAVDFIVFPRGSAR